MRFVLVNPNWSYDGSVYFGCREVHYPIELGYVRALLEAEGHEVLLIDAQAGRLSPSDIGRAAASFGPDYKILTTAPGYLFWRCPPPELKAPKETARALEAAGGDLVAIGPHGSVTPEPVLRKLRAKAVIMGEPEEVVPLLPDGGIKGTPSVAFFEDGALRVTSPAHAARMDRLPALKWREEEVVRHTHHHHRFDAVPEGLGAEIEYSRGCPYRCTFCARGAFRNNFRKRPLGTVLDEIDHLSATGVRYFYFIDEIFMPDISLLEELRRRDLKFGVQTRIDVWEKEKLDLLADAGCVSVEAGVESMTGEGRALLGKDCRLATEELAELLIYAKRRVPFVQATLLGTEADNPAEVEKWRQYLYSKGVWANSPVPLFPYPGTAEYARRWGEPDSYAWERAHEYYLSVNSRLSDIQDGKPLSLEELEGGKYGRQNA